MCCAAMDSYENIFFSQEAYPSIDFTLLDRPATSTTSAPHSTAALLPDLHSADSPFPSFELLNQNGVYSLGGLRVADEAHLREHGEPPELQEFHARHKERLLQLRSASMQGRNVGDINLGLPLTHRQLPLESHSPVSNVNLSSNRPLEQSQMQMLSSRNETAGEVHDFFEQTQITEEQGTPVSGGLPHLSQAWPGVNSRDDETQMGYHMAYKAEASNARDWIGNRWGYPELSNHLSSQSGSLVSSQPANDEASLKVTHSFLPVGQQSMESRQFSNKGLSLQNVQSSPNPTVIRTQPRNQPLDFEGLFADSTTHFETGNASSVQKERVDESSLVGQNVLYNHVQNMKLACQNHEVMPQERPPQNYNRLGGQISTKANLEGAFEQQPGMETGQYMQQHVLYQQYIQEMHRQQQLLQLERHSQRSRQEQLQFFWAAQNKGFATQFSQEQNLPKVGAECWQFPHQPQFYQPQNTSGNVHWPVITSSSMLGEINNHSLGPPCMSLQQLAPRASTLNSSVVDCSSNDRRDDRTVVSEIPLPNAQVGVDYCSGGIAKHAIGGPLLNMQGPYDPNTEPSTHPGVSLGRKSSYNNFQIVKLQPFDKFSFGQITQEAGFQSVDNAKNTNSYYEEDFQSSSRLVDYPIRQQQNWAGVSDREEQAQVTFCPQSSPEDATQSSMRRSDVEKQEMYQKSNSPQSGSESLLRNQSKFSGTHQCLEHGRIHSLNEASLRQQGRWNALGMQHQSPQHREAMDSANMEVGQRSWSNLLLHDTQFQSGSSHQTGLDVNQQVVWNNASLQNGSPLSGSTLHLSTDLDGRHPMVDSDPPHSSQVVIKTGVDSQLSESRLSQEQGSLQTGSSFLAHAGSAEMLHDNCKTHSFQQANDQSGNSLQAFWELEEKLDEDLPYQQLLQRAIEDDGPFQLTEMDWQHQPRSWDQTLQHGLHDQAIFPSNQCMSRESKAEITQERDSISQSTQIYSKFDSHVRNSEEYFASTGISQSHAGGLEGRPQIVQVADRMQAETFQLPRNVVAKKIMGQVDSRVPRYGSDVGTNLDTSGVDVRSKEKMQILQNNHLVGNSDYVSQELASKLWASQNVMGMQEFSPQLWSLPISNAGDNNSGMKKDGSVISNVGQRGNKVDFAQQDLHDDREKLLNVKHSVLESLQKDRYTNCTMDSNAKLQRRLHSPNFSDSIGGSTAPRLSLISSNLVSSWYTPEVTSTESMNVDELIESEAEVQQLSTQQNGQKSITRTQANYVVDPSQIKEKTSSMRTEITPEANPFRHVLGNGPDDTLPPADSLVSSSYLSASRNTLQLLNKPDLAETMSPPTEVNQQHHTSASQSESGSIGHNVPLSENHQKQPMSPQHFGLRLGPPAHPVPSTGNGRSSAVSRFWNADDETTWPGNEGQGHGLPVSLRTRASESGEVRLAQKDLSAETSTLDFTRVFQPMTVTTGSSLQSSKLTNELQNPELLPSHFAVQFSSGSIAHRLPYLGSANHRSSYDFTSGKSCVDESIVVNRAGVSPSSNLESNPESTSISVARQDDPVSQKKTDAVAMHQPKLSNHTSFSKLPDNCKNSISGQRQSLREDRPFPGVFESFCAPVPRREDRLQINLLHETNNQLATKVESPMNSESGSHLGPRKNSMTPGHTTLTGHASRLDKNSTDNMASDYSRGNAFSGSVAQSEAVEEVHLSASQRHTRVSAIQTNPSSVYNHAHSIQSEMQTKMLRQAHLRSLLGQTPASKVQHYINSQSKNLIQRPSNVAQKVSDSHTTSPVELAAMQQSSNGESPDEEGKTLGIIEGQNNLKCSNQHAHHPFGPDTQDSRPQVASAARVRQLEHSFPTSMLTPLQGPQSGPTLFSNQCLVTGASFIHDKVESQAHSQLPSCSLTKDSYESVQGHSQRRIHATGALPSGCSEKTQNSSSIKKQARMLSSSSLAWSGYSAEQSGIKLQPSESVDLRFDSSTNKGPNVTADNQINSSIKEGQNFEAAKPSADLQGSSSKPAKTISSLPLKRRKEGPPLMPWHMTIAQSTTSLPTTSGAELQWAAAVNRLPEKGDEGVDLRDKNLQFAYRAKQRLRLTTQLMQTVVAPAPAALMQSSSVEGRESATFTVAKVVLGDACGLAGGRRRQNDKPSRMDICGGCNFADLLSKQQKVFAGTSLRLEAATKLMDEFKARVKRLDNCLSRLESLPSASEIMTEVQQLDKLYITNRLVDRHFDEFVIEETDSLSGGKAISVVSHGAQKVFPRRYVTAVPMPSKLPDGTHLISL
ncbi:hypothetical protein O6H91_01G000300 [Diphasiastrum complanatum]|uniref:Uncharacterized protein n=1 Tax=Diphasiastrum complanatum TaxID=34168 RepID=A0ACC2EM94_DIPCM|nr:hypothetical protein O6H91_01G000300 [Diphasiastrum complanatum]